MMTGGPPATFSDLRSLVKIHLTQILKLDQITKKVPIYAVALLVVVAYEALGKYLHPRKGPEFLFAQEHLARHHVPVSIGGAIFDALRNGLAHTYRPYPIVVGSLGEVRLQLTWKDGAVAHLRGVSVRMVDGHQRYSAFPNGSGVILQDVLLNVDSMCRDLIVVFARHEKRLAKSADLAASFDLNVKKNREAFTRKAVGTADCQWRNFLTTRRMEKPG